MNKDYTPLKEKYMLHRSQILVYLLILLFFGWLLGFLLDQAITNVEGANVSLDAFKGWGMIVLPVIIIFAYLPMMTGIQNFYYFGDKGIYHLYGGSFLHRWAILLYVLIYNRMDRYLNCIPFHDIVKIRLLIDRVHAGYASYNFYNIYMKVVTKDEVIRFVISDAKLGFLQGTIFSSPENIINSFAWLKSNGVVIEDHFGILDIFAKGEESIWEHFEEALPKMIHFDDDGDIIETDGKAL